MKRKVIRTKFCEECGKPLRSDAVLLLCREHGKVLRNKLFHSKNKERQNLKSREYREKNIESIRKYDRAREKTPDRKLLAKNRERKQLRENSQVRLGKYLRNTVYCALKSNTGAPGGKAEKFLGCSIGKYKEYLTQLFQEGMSWGNYGEWHIDHIEPIFKFNLERKDEFLKAANYKNTQPMWAKDNIIKRDIELKGCRI